MMRPEEIYQRIEAKNWRHVWVVGDIHGCFSMLMKRLRECQFDPQQDLLVSVGDLIDRGPDSLGCLALLRESWMTAVRGNHEQNGAGCAGLIAVDAVVDEWWRLVYPPDG